MGYYVTEPRGGDNQARIKVAGSLAARPRLRLARRRDSMYYAARIVLGDARTSGDGALRRLRPARLPRAELPLAPPPAGGRGRRRARRAPRAVDADAWATWQGGAGADCSAVPVRAVTWGRLKGLYR